MSVKNIYIYINRKKKKSFSILIKCSYTTQRKPNILAMYNK